MSIRPRLPVTTLVRGGRPVPGAPDRFLLSEAQWRELAERLPADPIVAGGLWGDGDAVHLLLLDGPDAPLLASVAVDNKRITALSPARPNLAICERILRDLWGIEAMGALDLRPWLDHGEWKQSAPLSARPGPAPWPPEPFEFEWNAADEIAGAMQLPLGPVQSVVDGPAQIRLTLVGERIRRVEPLFGFNHRGVAFRLRGATIAEAAALVGRIDATAAVANEIAFAQAVEAAAGWTVAGDTRALRTAMGAVERIALALRRIDPAARERLLDASGTAFGHRLMRGTIVPGGWRAMPIPSGLDALAAELGRLESHPPSGSATETLRRDLATARRSLTSPAGEPAPQPPAGIREGLGHAESGHGPIWHWVRLEAGSVIAFHAVDPMPGRLAELVARAPGLSPELFEAACAASTLSSAGADQ